MTSETIPGLLVDEMTDAEADEVIRASKPATFWPACCGCCNQGEGICPTPEACQMAIDDEAFRSTEAMGRLLVYSVTVVAVCAFVAWVMP